MPGSFLLVDRSGSRRSRALLLGMSVVAFMARHGIRGATLEVQNQNDPGGDPTSTTYRLTADSAGRRWVPDFALRDGDTSSYGPDPAVYGNVLHLAGARAGRTEGHVVQCREIDPPTGAELPTDRGSSQSTSRRAG